MSRQACNIKIIYANEQNTCFIPLIKKLLRMKALNALIGGLAGACAITVLHQVIKSKDDEAPRMDLLGMESLTKIMNKAGVRPPADGALYYITMAGDIVSNTFYYSLTGIGRKKTWLKGPALGLAAGIGAVLLPKPLGLNPKHSNYTRQTQLLSVLYYLAGGVVSSAVTKLLEHKTDRSVKAKVGKLRSKIAAIV
jgi:hypothetical protein